MEYLPGGSLAGMLRQFAGVALPQAPARRYFRDVVHGLAFLHSHSVVHRDLKPANVLVTIEGQCKLADFGACVELAAAGRSQTDPDRGMMPAGTPLYMSPEQARGAPQYASDLWAAGIVLCELAGGTLPWPAWARADPFNLIFRLGTGDIDPPTFSPAMPADAKDLCRQCFRHAPAERPTAEVVLSHSYLLK